MGQSDELEYSGHFLKRYADLTEDDQLEVLKALAEFLRMVRLGGGRWARKYKKMQGVSTPTYEVRTTKSHRVLVEHSNGAFVVVDASPHRDGHDVTYDHAALTKAQRAVRAQTSGTFFAGPLDQRVLREYEGRLDDLPQFEAHPREWVRHPDKEQDQAAWECLSTIERWRQGRAPKVVWLLGGPGTGKTVVLTTVLELARTLFPSMPISWHSPKSVQDFLRACGMDLPARAAPSPGCLVLIDDPPTELELERQIATAVEADARAVIVAFDPLQFQNAWKAGWLSRLEDQFSPLRHELHTCYRQHGNVGRAARDVSTAIYTKNSKFLVQSKIDRYNQALEPFLELSIKGVKNHDDFGLVKVHQGANWVRAWDAQCRRINARDDLWTRKGWPPMAVMYEAKVKSRLTAQRKRELPTHRVVDLADAGIQIRGQEFQEVWILISQESYEMIQRGRHGLGTAEYEYLTNLHLAYSRAKDAVITFVG